MFSCVAWHAFPGFILPVLSPGCLFFWGMATVTLSDGGEIPHEPQARQAEKRAGGLPDVQAKQDERLAG
jgi:hypothetical protein